MVSLSGKWNVLKKGDSLSQKFMGTVKPEAPLKNRLDVAQKKLQLQVNRLGEIDSKLKTKHDAIFEKIVNAKKINKNAYAQAYASELAQVRKMKNMVSGAKLSMEQVKLRLDTVSELGDVVVTLSPCMSIIKGLAPSLNGLMPEASASMQNMSQILGDVMSGSSMNLNDGMDATVESNEDSLSILEEAHNVIVGQTKSTIPDVPENLKQEINNNRSDILI